MCSPTSTPAPAAPITPPAALKRCAGCDALKPLRDFGQGNKPASELKTCAGCRARVAKRRRERKQELRTERERHAEQAVQQLMFALDRIPAGEEYDEWREHVHRAAHRIRKSAKRTPDRDVEAVTSAMRKPLVHEASDIALEAQLPRKDVERILSAMLATGAVTRRPRSAAALGPKVWLYSLSPSGPATSDVLP
jgi:hypothetical protein